MSKIIEDSGFPLYTARHLAKSATPSHITHLLPLFVPEDDAGKPDPDAILLSEMHRISPGRWANLNSEDRSTRSAEQRHITEITTIMARRARRMMEWISWKSLKGQVVVDTPAGRQITKRFPVQRSTATIPWTDYVNSAPSRDLKVLRDTLTGGNPYIPVTVYMNSTAAKNMRLSNEWRRLFSISEGTPFVPTESDIERELKVGIKIVDSGYRQEHMSDHDSKIVTYLKDGEVIVTLGQEDPVGRLEEPWFEDKDLGVIQGMNVHVVEDTESKNKYVRVDIAVKPVVEQQSVCHMVVGV